MDNITKINACIDMLNRIKRLRDDVDINQYSKAIDSILKDIDYLDTDISTYYIKSVSASVTAQAIEAFWKSFETSNEL